MRSMNKTRHDDLNLLVPRFVQNLSASSRSRQGVYSPGRGTIHCGIPEIPAALDPLSLCSYTIPCLSLHTRTTLTGGAGDHFFASTTTSDASASNHDDNEEAEDCEHVIGIGLCSPSSTTARSISTPTSSPAKKQVAQERRHKRLLARELECNTVSAASSIMLMNFVETFGKLLQIELQKRLYLLVAKLEQNSSNSLGNKQRKEAVYKAFEDQALMDKPPVVPVAFSTRFYTNEDSSSTHCQNKIGLGSSTSIMFEANIQLQLHPSYSLVTCRLTAPGHLKLNYPSESSIMESIHVMLDMDVLYRAVMRECKYVSKLALNGIIGHMNYGNKWIRNKPDADAIEIDSPKNKTITKKTNSKIDNRVIQQSTTSTSMLPSDSVTQSTIATSEDRCLEEFKRGALINRTRSKSQPRCSHSNNEKQFSPSKQLKQQKYHHKQQHHHQQQKLKTPSWDTPQPPNPLPCEPSKKKVLKWLAKIPSAKRVLSELK